MNNVDGIEFGGQAAVEFPSTVGLPIIARTIRKTSSWRWAKHGKTQVHGAGTQQKTMVQLAVVGQFVKRYLGAKNETDFAHAVRFQRTLTRVKPFQNRLPRLRESFRVGDDQDDAAVLKL